MKQCHKNECLNLLAALRIKKRFSLQERYIASLDILNCLWLITDQDLTKDLWLEIKISQKIQVQ